MSEIDDDSTLVAHGIRFTSHLCISIRSFSFYRRIHTFLEYTYLIKFTTKPFINELSSDKLFFTENENKIKTNNYCDTTTIALIP